MNPQPLIFPANSAKVESRQKAALDTNCSDEVFHALKNDSDPIVRLRMTANPSCPAEILWELRNDAHGVKGMAGNPNCPEELLLQIGENPKHQELRKTTIYNETIRRLLQNPSCPQKLLNKFADDLPDLDGDQNRKAILSNPNCPKELFIRIAENPKFGVGKIEAGRHCPTEIIPIIENQPWVKNGLLFNPNCPARILEEWYEDMLAGKIHNHKEHIEDDLKKIIRHPNCPEKILKELTSHSSASIRAAVQNRQETDNTQKVAEKTPATLLRQFFNYQLGKSRLDVKTANGLRIATKPMLTQTGTINKQTLEKLSPEEVETLKPLASQYAKQMSEPCM